MKAVSVALLAVLAILQMSVNLAEEANLETEDVKIEDEIDIGTMVSGGFNTIRSAVWQARIDHMGRPIGNGLLITRQFVLTSGLTIINPRDNIEYNPANVTVALGFTNATNPGRGHRVVRAVQLQAHHDCLGRVNNFAHNIGLIKLIFPVRVNRLLSPLSIPTRGNQLSVGRRTTVVSWGVTLNGRRRALPGYLQQATFTVLSQTQVRRQVPRLQINANTVYISDRNASMELLDNGAPVFPYARSNVQAIVSHQVARNITAVLQIAPYAQWINTVIANL